MLFSPYLVLVITQTPRKCFERAAEKCHTDSLASIVAACSWGKRVAVGTGTRFDVLWDAKEVYNYIVLSESFQTLYL